MSVIACGVDLVECERIAHLLRDHPERFLDRILTAAEQAKAKSLVKPIPHIAGRFAAKEAILKVLGTGWRGQIAWTDMEVTNNEWGQPHVSLTGACAKVATDRGIAHILLSISHTDHYATATALGLSEESFSQ